MKKIELVVVGFIIFCMVVGYLQYLTRPTAVEVQL